MRQKFLLLFLTTFIITNSVDTFSQNAKVSQQKPQMLQSSPNGNNQLEIITYVEGFKKDESSRLGYSVAGIGDVNLDGFDDVLISNFDKGPGEVWLLYGGAEMDSLPDMVFYGENDYDNFGSTVAAGGDINGDGAPDFLISASSYYLPNDTSYTGPAGRLYVYYGGSLLDTIPDLTITGEKGGDVFGRRIVAGDVNGDLCNDILTSTVSFRYNNTSYGKAYLYYGGNVLDAIPEWTNIGDTSHTYLGSTLAIGDINSDQKQDILIVSSPGGYNPAMTVTEIFLNKTGFDTIPDHRIIYPLYGDARETLLFCSDFNQDGIDDFLTKYYGYKIYYGSQQFDLESDAYLEPWPFTYIRHFADAGDVNGDGFPDVIGGAPHYVFETGSVQLFLGSKNINSTADWTAGGQGRLGIAVDGAGDVNGDGYDDIIVSDSVFPFTNIGRGIVYILAGNPDLEDNGASQVIDQSKIKTPVSFKLQQNYPNPFNSQTTIHYELKNIQKQPVKLTIHNIQGKEVITLVEKMQSAGLYSGIWDGKDNSGNEMNSGVYLGVLKINQVRQVIKMLLVK